MTSRPAISGSVRRPEPVGLAPFTVWKKSGRKTLEPNSAKPTISPVAPAIVKVRFWNSRSGSTGSAARRSTRTNSAPRATPAQAVPIRSAEPHAQVLPPRLVASTMQLSDAASRPAPR